MLRTDFASQGRSSHQRDLSISLTVKQVLGALELNNFGLHLVNPMEAMLRALHLNLEYISFFLRGVIDPFCRLA